MSGSERTLDHWFNTTVFSPPAPFTFGTGNRTYRSFDIVSPWTIGRFRDAPGTDRSYADEVKRDLAETHRLGIDYMPVV